MLGCSRRSDSSSPSVDPDLGAGEVLGSLREGEASIGERSELREGSLVNETLVSLPALGSVTTVDRSAVPAPRRCEITSLPEDRPLSPGMRYLDRLLLLMRALIGAVLIQDAHLAAHRGLPVLGSR